MSKRSLRIELAVSMPPAPLPMIVWVPECSDVKEIAFSVPFTHNGSSSGISDGSTLSFLLHIATSFMAQFFLAALFMCAVLTLRIPVHWMSGIVTFIPIIQFARITSFAAASKPSKSRDSSASTYPLFFASSSAFPKDSPVAIFERI